MIIITGEKIKIESITGQALPAGNERTIAMSTTTPYQPVDPEFYARRARRLRSAAAVSVFGWIGRAILASLLRAYVRPYRMTRTPGCGCEA